MLAVTSENANWGSKHLHHYGAISREDSRDSYQGQHEATLVVVDSDDRRHCFKCFLRQ